MYQKIDKAKVICLAYKNGTTIKQIASAFNQEHSLIRGYLERYFEKFYGEPFKPFAELRAERLEEIYKKYKEFMFVGYLLEIKCVNFANVQLWNLKQ